MNREEKLYKAVGDNLPESQASKMFGKPCHKYKGKVFMAFIDNMLLVKLTGDDLANALSWDGASRFDPYKINKPMKEWVLIPFDYAAQWQEIAAQALDYCKQLNDRK